MEFLWFYGFISYCLVCYIYYFINIANFYIKAYIWSFKRRINSFSEIFLRIHPRRGTPYIAVLFMGVLTIPFVLIGDLGFVAELANISILIIFIVVNPSLLRLRYTDKLDQGYKTPLNIGKTSITAVIDFISSLSLILFYIYNLF